MGNLLDKMNEVIQFLETIFVDQRIVTSFHANQSMVALPEIRVYLEQINENGLLHWKVEFAPRSYTQLSDQIADIQTFREAISTSSRFRYLPGKTNNKSRNWSEEIIQPWTPDGMIAQRLYLRATLLANTTNESPANSNIHNNLNIVEAPNQNTFPCFIVNGSETVFLGEATLVGTSLSTEFSSGQNYPPGSSLYILEDEMIFTHAGTELINSNVSENVRVYQTMDKQWKKVRLSPSQWETQLQFPLLSNSNIESWKTFNNTLQEMPVAFFITRARNVYLSNTITSNSINDPGGLTGILDITLKCSTFPEEGLS